RVLKGANPAELPVVQASKFEMIINVETARILDLSVSPMLLAHHRVIPFFLLQPAPPGVHDTAELSEDPVACRVDDPTAVVSNHREDNGLVLFEITNGGSLVSAHERGIAGDVGSEDRCQFTGNPWISKIIGHRTATGSNTCG